MDAQYKTSKTASAGGCKVPEMDSRVSTDYDDPCET